jgi:hypothetical protein
MMNHLWYSKKPLRPAKFLKSRPDHYVPDVDVCYLKFPERPILGSQFGGFGEDMKREYRYQHKIGGITCTSKITCLYATDENDEELAQFYLLSPQRKINDLNCAFAKIEKNKATVVDMVSFSNKYSCTDHGDPPKAGRIYVTMMLQFLAEHKEQLGIKRFELGDDSKHHCRENHLSFIPLEIGRQLAGNFPYYMQFGFRPKYKKNMKILERNRQIMSSIITHQIDLVKLFGAIEIPEDIVTYFETHKEQPLTRTMLYINQTNCVFYSSICDGMFNYLKLTRLEHPEYVMNVEDFVPIVEVVEMR